MSLVLQSELQAADSCKAITCLTNDMDDSKKLLAAIENFISSSPEVLKGESFDAVRSHMQAYVDALNERIKVAEKLIDAIKGANSSMISYMDGEPKLDTADIEPIRSQMNNYNSTAQSYLDRYNNYSESEKISKEALFELYNECKRLASDEERKLKLLENLDSTDSSIFSKLQSSADDISSFKGTIGGIKTIKV